MSLMEICNVTGFKTIRVWDRNYGLVYDCKEDGQELLEEYGNYKIDSVEPTPTGEYCIDVYLL